jgi:hypothetical protein
VRRLAAAVWLTVLLAPRAEAELYYLIVGGLGGQPGYAENFAEYAGTLALAARRTVSGESQVRVLSGEQATREALREQMLALAETTTESDRLILILLGHGSFDGETYKFNLTGPDMDDAELRVLLDSVPAAAQLVVNTTSASGAVLEKWETDGRVLITATRSGAERNATRFGEHFAAALSSAEADINKSGVISAQEAFDFASRMVADNFEADGALATEHPQLVGDGAGAFEVSRLIARRLDSPILVDLNAELAALEDRIAALRLRREELGDQYLPQLQTLLVQLALVQERIDGAEAD